MPITLKKDVWKVKDPSSGQYRGAAILSTTLPQDAAQIISESNATIQNIKDTAIEAVDTALNDESTGLIPKAEADRDAIDDSLNNASTGIIPTAQSDRDDIDDSLNNINDGIIPEAQANLATIAAAVQSQISQGTDKTLSVAKGFADAKAAGMMVKVSNYQPGSALDDPATSQDASQNTGYPVYKDSNRVWVKETYAELEVPTMEDVDELKSAIHNIDISSTLTFVRGYYTAEGAWDDTLSNPHAACTCTNFIDGRTLKKISITPLDADVQVYIVRFDSSTERFISRESWNADGISESGDYKYKVGMSYISSGHASVTPSDFNGKFVVFTSTDQDVILNCVSDVADIKASNELIILMEYGNTAFHTPENHEVIQVIGANVFSGETISIKESGYLLGFYDSTASIKTGGWVSSWTPSQNYMNGYLVVRAEPRREFDFDSDSRILTDYVDGHITGGNVFVYSPLYIKQQTTSESKWKDKKVAFLGDSITYGVNTSKTYHEVLNEMLGFSEKYADGIAGSSVSSKATDSYTPMCQRAANIPTDSDLVIVFGGTNDFGHSTPLGTIDDETDVSFYGAVQLTIKTIIAANPDVRLAWMLPLHRIRGNYIGENENNEQGLKLISYIEALKLACAKWSIPVIDTYSTYGLNPAISQVYSAYITDGLHPNTAGHKLLAERVAPLLELL